ncbi:Crp/Fnr family transcriptional regulator [Myxacorys almedinensis]|uniref:Helix-turn-helix domain-containing protein n=1 Tax=Myxacorys almedinensis A TaxID=2690445 RepID=A0A8J7YZI3_9CYAN|nr:Crp/Fnr family transcriptional regulator [Myxacorys almedinensis]NDJ16240.1 helix-turn-helix domain-containing protein [Myxacorys almedinensis A]
MRQDRSTHNKLLSALSNEEYNRLVPYLELVSLPFKHVLYEPNQSIDYVYFPNSGVISMVTITEDGETVEAATTGNEGMVGIAILLGVDQSPLQAIAQVAGDALRMRSEVFRREVTRDSLLYVLLLRYTQAMISQLSQTVACNRLHSVEERCCRWLLLCHDRVGSNEFFLTQELLSQMLGVRRASVSVVAAILQKAGLIRYTRGKIRILDRQGLESASCECYRVVKTEFDRLLGDEET